MIGALQTSALRDKGNDSRLHKTPYEIIWLLSSVNLSKVRDDAKNLIESSFKNNKTTKDKCHKLQLSTILLPLKCPWSGESAD